MVDHEQLREARDLAAAGRYADLLRLLDGVNGSGEALYLRAYAMHRSGHDAAKALALYREALGAGFDAFWVHLNRGLLEAETGSYERALDALEAAKSSRPERPEPDAPIAQIRRFFSTATEREKQSPYRPPIGAPDQTLEWLECESIPQSMQFMIDCLPVIRDLTRGWPEETPMDVLDAGTASGAGANLLATLHRRPWQAPRMRVEALDIQRHYKPYAAALFPDIRYTVADLFQLPAGRSWDLILCSHTIEHFDDPVPFIGEIQRRARHWALFYAPFEEQNRLDGHCISIGQAFIDRFDPIVSRVQTSPVWLHPVDKDPKTVLFVLEGKAGTPLDRGVRKLKKALVRKRR